MIASAQRRLKKKEGATWPRRTGGSQQKKSISRVSVGKKSDEHSRPLWETCKMVLAEAKEKKQSRRSLIVTKAGLCKLLGSIARDDRGK